MIKLRPHAKSYLKWIWALYEVFPLRIWRHSRRCNSKLDCSIYRFENMLVSRPIRVQLFRCPIIEMNLSNLSPWDVIRQCEQLTLYSRNRYKYLPRVGNGPCRASQSRNSISCWDFWLRLKSGGIHWGRFNKLYFQLDLKWKLLMEIASNNILTYIHSPPYLKGVFGKEICTQKTDMSVFSWKKKGFTSGSHSGPQAFPSSCVFGAQGKSHRNLAFYIFIDLIGRYQLNLGRMVKKTIKHWGTWRFLVFSSHFERKPDLLKSHVASLFPHSFPKATKHTLGKKFMVQTNSEFCARILCHF